ncbi:hypothetical protein [Moorena sp. SIO3I8]|uniref:hypothetical protein n=1 Tax=Moorena sp. SIO3I8 TaxID=2607833 RepID=UPI0025DFCD9F|nr:hypothetical protein [Moorena sp. SIO3I8]
MTQSSNIKVKLPALANLQVRARHVIFSVNTQQSRLLVLQEEAFLGKSSLPGTLVWDGESLDHAADWPWPWPIGHATRMGHAGRVWPRYAIGLGLWATRGAFGHATRTDLGRENSS